VWPAPVAMVVPVVLFPLAYTAMAWVVNDQRQISVKASTLQFAKLRRG
jgi:hypothetical protein